MKKCKQGYYYCYTDKVCKPLSKGMRVTARFSGNGKEPEETGIDVPLNGNGAETDGGNGDGGGTVSEEGLRDWFGKSKSKDGKKGWVNVVTGGTCASDEPGEGTPKCVSSAKRASMTKAERLSAQRRKKKADPGQQQKSGAAKPTYVSTDSKKKMKKEEVEVNEAKDKKGKGSGSKDACYHKVKSRYSVWPSAYASGALVKCRKVGAANWGNKTEKMDEEWVVDNAAQYFFNEGINEEGLAIFIEELGVENFVEFVHDLAEDSELIEAYALTGKKKTPKRLPKGTQPAKTTKKTIARGDSKIKAASPSGAFKKRPAAAKAVETAKEKQPEKKPVKSNLVKGVADTLARGALSAWKGHKAAMKKKKEGGSVASQVGTGLATAAGAMLKKGKKHLSDHYNYSNWRDDFKAMEYEFIDIIKPEPLVTEASFEIKHTSADVRKAEKQKKIDNLAQQGSTEGERRAAARKTRTSLPPIQKNHVELEGEQIEEGQKCWKGYEKKGTKKMFGKTYNNCVKKEENEIDEMISTTGIRVPDQEKVKARKTKPEKKKLPKGYVKFFDKKGKGRIIDGKKVYEEGYAPGDVDQKVGAVTAIPKKDQDAAKARLLAKAKAKREKMKKENEIDEAKHTPTKSDLESKIGGGNLKKLSKKASTRIDYDVDGDVDPQDKVEKSKGDYGEELPTPFGKFRTGDSKKVIVKKESLANWRNEIEEGAAWTKKSGKSESGGLNEKGRKSYERENPGSDLKAPSKKVGNPRRKSFCARMKGMKKKLTSSKTANDPDSRINKSLRAWNC
jgi:hypothetical protein